MTGLSLLSIELFFVDGNGAVGVLILPDTFLSKILQLGIQGALIHFGDLCDLVKQLRLKTDACLYLVCGHDNTPIIE